MALATIDDYQDITGITPDNPTQVERLLEVASGRILANAYGQTIVEATTTDTIRPQYGIGRFPQRPVSAVLSVVVDGVTLTPDVDYRWTRGGNGQHAYLYRRRNGFDSRWGSAVEDRIIDDWRRIEDSEITVTSTHGFNPIPDVLIAEIVKMVHAGVTTAAHPVHLQSQMTRLGSYEESQRFFQASATATTIDADTQDIIDDLFGVEGPTNAAVTRDR